MRAAAAEAHDILKVTVERLDQRVDELQARQLVLVRVRVRVRVGGRGACVVSVHGFCTGVGAQAGGRSQQS
jgi:hypothetical protein